MSDSVRVGDRIKINAELLRLLYERIDHESEIVILEKILDDDDGVKILVLSPEERR